MTTVTVEGSKNDFSFGPHRIEIPDGLAGDEEAGAVVDSLTRSDHPDGISSSPAPDLEQNGHSPRDRAIQHGYTAIRYRHGESGRSIRIL